MPTLTQKALEAAIRKRDRRKVYDERGMYLEVPASPAASPRWRLKYRVAGREKLLALGLYPEVSLAEARERREDARRLLAQGIDPSAHRKATRSAEADTFEAVAREWHAKHATTWAASHASRVLARLERFVFPYLGRQPVGSVKAADVLAVLQRVEKRGTIETAHRVKWLCGQVLRYAVATGRAERDCTSDLRGALTPTTAKHFAAVTDAPKLAELLRALEGYQGQPMTGWALRLAPLVFVRPGELRHAEWSEIDLEAGAWVIPAAKMKMGRDHVVPLSSQAIAILREAHALTGSGRFVFPSLRTSTRPMSENTVNAALRRLGYSSDEATGHGFRATARTMLAEVLGYRAELIEHQLAHAVRDPLGRAYNRAQFLEERRTMMQAWADYLDGLKAGGKVIPLRRA